MSRLDSDREALGDAVREAVDVHLSEFGMGSADGFPGVPVARNTSPGKEEDYLQARRSIHMWPMDSASKPALLAYSKKYLQMTEEDIAGFITACRKSSKINDEFCIQFSTIAERDSFHAFAPRLHSFQRSARMRLALPDHLIQTFKLLENEGFRIVSRHVPWYQKMYQI